MKGAGILEVGFMVLVLGKRLRVKGWRLGL